MFKFTGIIKYAEEKNTKTFVDKTDFDRWGKVLKYHPNLDESWMAVDTKHKKRVLDVNC